MSNRCMVAFVCLFKHCRQGMDACFCAALIHIIWGFGDVSRYMYICVSDLYLDVILNLYLDKFWKKLLSCVLMLSQTPPSSCLEPGDHHRICHSSSHYLQLP